MYLRTPAFILVAALASVPKAQAAYTFIEISGSTTGSTIVSDINNAGVAVGSINDSAGLRGFSWTAGVLTEIKVPGAFTTQVRGINDAGILTGVYEDRVGSHGFIGTVGAFTKFDVPAAAPGRTTPFSINNKNQIVGVYQVTIPGSAMGFEYDAGTFTTLTIAGSTGVTATAINDAGLLGGDYLSSTGDQGFVTTAGGGVTKINAPGGAVAFVQGLSNTGQYVGYYHDDTATHGLTNAGIVDYPGAKSTLVYGVNDVGQLGGAFLFDPLRNVDHGFITFAPAGVPVGGGTTAVPEPASLAVLGAMLAGAALSRRRA